MEQELINAIGSVGFPIVACIYMAWMHNEQEKRHEEKEEQHSKERVAMTEALTKMNVVLSDIRDMLGKGSNGNA